MQIKQSAIEQVKVTFKRRIEELEHAQGMLQNVLLGAGWIVRNGVVTITYDVVENKAINARPCGVEMCRRFSKEDAEAVAASTFNGNGEPAKAVHVTQAVEEALADFRKALASLETGK